MFGIIFFLALFISFIGLFISMFTEDKGKYFLCGTSRASLLLMFHNKNSYGFPLVNTVYLLSTSAVNLANSANILTLSPIVHSKKSEIKKILDLVYDMDE